MTAIRRFYFRKMTVHDILTLASQEVPGPLVSLENSSVTEKMPAMLLLPHFLSSPDAKVDVTDPEGVTVGTVDSFAMLRGLGEMFGNDSGETSWVEASVRTSDYSASAVARAVEDVDANLLDMLTSPDPADPARMRLTLKISHSDPAAVVRSLERYGYEVVSSDSASTADMEKVRERLSELSLYLSM